MDRQLESFDSVMCHVSTKTKQEAILETVENCPIFSSLPDKDKFIKAVLRREEIETTGIGHGIAVAHGKVKNLSHILVGLGISETGIDYEAKEGQPDQFHFVIASTPSRQLEYIKTISNILRTLRDEDVRKELLSIKQNCTLDQIQSQECQSLLRMLLTQHFAWIWKHHNL